MSMCVKKDMRLGGSMHYHLPSKGALLLPEVDDGRFLAFWAGWCYGNLVRRVKIPNYIES